MATEWASAERDALKAVVAEAQGIVAGDLMRDELGPFNFRTGAKDIARVRRLLNELAEADLELVGANLLQQVTNHMTTIRDLLKKIPEFDAVAVSSPAQARDAILSQLRSSYEVVLELATPILAFASRRDQSTEAILEEARTAVGELQRLRKTADDEQVALRKEMEDILGQARTVAASAGVAEFTKLFADEAAKQDASSQWWLKATVVLAIATLIYTFIAAGTPFGWLALPDKADTAQSIQLGLAKALIFTVLISAVIWAGRNYRSHRHNHVVNQHRANALGTFQVFAKAAGDDAATKNAVLLQATLAIFSPQPSGYVSHDTDQVGSSQALEVIRGIMSPRS